MLGGLKRFFGKKGRKIAAPIIDSVTVDPPSVAPGGTAIVTIDAHDPDTGQPAQVFAFEAVAVASDGERVTVSGEVTREGTPGDTIDSYEVVDPNDAGLVIEPTARPNVFRVTVPA